MDTKLKSSKIKMKSQIRCFIAALGLLTSSGLHAEKAESERSPTAETAREEGVTVAAEAAPAGGALELLPRAEGAVWTYRSYVLYEEGGKVMPSGVTTETVERVLNLDGKKVFLVRLTTDERTLIERMAGVPLSEWANSWFWEYFDQEGRWELWVDSNEETPESLEDFDITYRYPAVKGQTYTAKDETPWEVKEIDLEVVVPAGKFGCVVYQSVYKGDEEEGFEDSRETFYLSPGTGLVKWEMEYFIDGEWKLDSRDELTRVTGLEAAEASKSSETAVEQ